MTKMRRLFAYRRCALFFGLLVAVYVLGRILVYSARDASISHPFTAQEPCSMLNSCDSGKISLSLATEANSAPPSVCINNIKLFDEAKIVRGFGVAVLNERNQVVEDVRYFEMSSTDRALMDFLSHIKPQKILIIASYGDVSESLSTGTKQLLSLFGSTSLDKFGPGQGLVFIGQRGLRSHNAIEQVAPLGNHMVKVFSKCIDFPLGDLSKDTIALSSVDGVTGDPVMKEDNNELQRKLVQFGKRVKNCGVTHTCGKGTIALSFYSGKNKDDAPRICVNDHFVVDRDLNGAGRGLNIVVIDRKTRQVLRVEHFDTYEKDSSDLVTFLEAVDPRELIAVVSFDEASSKLSDMAKQIFYELGSSLIANMKFRASWYFVGQKGIDGFTPFEDLNSPSNTDWAKPIDYKSCIPLNLRKLDLPLIPRLLSDPSRLSRLIFGVPILVVAGLDKNSARLTLESLMDQEGLNPSKVTVSFHEAYMELAQLATLFHMNPMPIQADSYSSLLSKSVSNIFENSKDINTLIIVEEDTIVSVDFLYFFDQLIDQFIADTDAKAILAYNKNSGDGESGAVKAAVYRVEATQPLAAYMIKRDSFDEKIVCCEVRSEWMLKGVAYFPAVSRVHFILNRNLDFYSDSWAELSNISQSYTSERFQVIDDPKKLTEDVYDQLLIDFITNASNITSELMPQCQMNGENISEKIFHARTSFLVTFNDDDRTLRLLSKCLNFFYSPKYGFYKGVFRLFVNGIPGVLVSSDSSLVTKGKAAG